MTFRELQDEVLTLRFKEGRRPSSKLWINTRYGDIWSAADWPFKHVSPSNVAVTTGNANPVLPAGFRRAHRIYDQYGNPLSEMLPQDFDDAYRYYAVNNVTGQPTDFKVVNGVLTLGPTPNVTATFTVAYERGPVHYNGSSVETALPMTADSDTPIWDSSYHYILVFGAMSMGLRLENDPSWPAVEDEFRNELSGMMNELLPPDRGETTQFGRDLLGIDV